MTGARTVLLLQGFPALQRVERSKNVVPKAETLSVLQRDFRRNRKILVGKNMPVAFSVVLDHHFQR